MLDEDGNVIEEATEAPDPGAAQRANFQGKDEKKDGEEPKKKIIRNPMPKLNPDRICGARGIGTLQDIFSDFQPKGGDHVFEDLDRAMHKMEHWAHRLYPKLPFDDVMARISVLGKKMAIQTHLKRTRMGLDPVIIGPNSAKNSDNEDNGGDDKDETKRYDNDDFPTEDDFEKLVREAEANRDDAFDEFDSLTKAPSPKPKTVLSDEQKERMEKNRQMAAEKRRVRQLEAEQKLSQNQGGNGVREEQKSKEDITEQKENIEDVSSLQLSDDDEDEQITFINHAAQDSNDDLQPLSQVYESARKSPQPDQTEIMDMSPQSSFEFKTKSKEDKECNLKISTWNVNGLRAWIKKDGLVDFLQHEKPDVICLQEIKCSKAKLPAEMKALSDYKHQYYFPAEKEGYAGVALLSKIEPLKVDNGFGIDEAKEHDAEGRVITAEFDKFFLVTAFLPYAGQELDNLPKRMEWDPLLRNHIKELDAKKPVILCGDLNVAHKEIDLANPRANKKNARFTVEERSGFDDMLNEGFVDTFRHFYPDLEKKYSFWSFLKDARSRNAGWRLDYFVTSKRLVDQICDNQIRDQVFGSNHCPSTLFLAL